jgi:hypothetical protein
MKPLSRFLANLLLRLFSSVTPETPITDIQDCRQATRALLNEPYFKTPTIPETWKPGEPYEACPFICAEKDFPTVLIHHPGDIK